ncbi:unnamed protein product [Brassica oleracea var. botrytis]
MGVAVFLSWARQLKSGLERVHTPHHKYITLSSVECLILEE